MILKSLIFIFTITNYLQAELALVIQPVIDLISAPAGQFNAKLSPTDYYKQIPLSPVNPAKNGKSCPRLHQALLHEIVDILETTKYEARVKILNAYFIDNKTNQKEGVFWTLKSNLIPIKKIDLDLLPTPINYLTPTNYEPNILTLTNSWQNFSAGTRFKLDPADGLAYCYQAITNSFIKIKIPKQFSICTNRANNSKGLRAKFVALVKRWAKPHNYQSIPYAWGGCSIRQRLSINRIKIINNHDLSYYQAAGQQLYPQTGIDCSGLVLRACQAVGIPYFYKNSATAAQELPCLKEHEQIKPGDLIWLSGHIIIIVNPKTGMCVEAREYGQGYGKVHQIHISKLFQQAANFDQIKAAYHEGRPLIRIDNNGVIQGKYRIKILKLLND